MVSNKVGQKGCQQLGTLTSTDKYLLGFEYIETGNSSSAADGITRVGMAMKKLKTFLTVEGLIHLLGGDRS